MATDGSKVKALSEAHTIDNKRAARNMDLVLRSLA
jgi:hypothetical protein